ncbi:MAG: peptide chain release factor N(5)-glutamine methyltransferase [Gammaproteobacteria bacterium]|nr:peptide chain release factor N(5)-glutamine methyltransferase [Gammaproteobacteria bacterium]NND35779.1 peptide chain release factor N(5)-glutamine methyltransferase [Gammaproteobacteria bacterium]
MHTDPKTHTATVSDLLKEMADELRDTSPSARLDAELLLSHVLRKNRTQLYTHADEKVELQSKAVFENLVHRRREGQPIAHLIGQREFWSLHLSVTEDTLVPRAETEILVGCALTHLPKDQAANVLDLGTGSGAVALAIANERPDVTITATDLSPAALRIARYNSHSLGLTKVQFKQGDWFGAVRNSKFSLIVANPPYVTDMELVVHDFELQHEPRLALAGGEDGLDAIKQIVEEAPQHLFTGGWLAIEHGHRQGPAVEILMREAGMVSIFGYSDLQGHTRVTEGKMRE